MSSATEFSVDENYSDENASAAVSPSKSQLVLSPHKSILKDSNVSNILCSSPQSLQTLKVTVILYIINNWFYFC